MSRCAMCEEMKPSSDFYKSSKASGSAVYSYCKPCTVKWQREWRAKKFAEDPVWAAKEKERAHQRSLKARRKLRRDVVAAYGGRCTCCGESTFEFLSLDHVNNDGAQHRRELGANGGSTVMTWAKKNGYPDTLQLLCHNCHGAKSWYGGCPHE